MNFIKHKIIVLINIICLSSNGNAQHIIPIENVVDYIDAGRGILENRTSVYVKDITNTLAKFTGTWKGVYKNINYEFRIIKHTDFRENVTEDMLLMRYKITSKNGQIIEDTTTLPNDDGYVLNGLYMDRDGGYVFHYFGKKGSCGQNGDVFISLYGINKSKMQLFLAVRGDIYPDCKARANQILPITSMELIKQ